MKTLPHEEPEFSAEEHAMVAARRRELQAIQRFAKRTYVYLLCKGRLEEAAELLRMYRGFGEIEHSLPDSAGSP